MRKIIVLLSISISAFGQVKVTSKNGKIIEVNSPATINTLGIIKLAGDLGGTADSPVVVGLGDKAPLFSPALTGVPIAPTPIAGDNTVKIATTEFVTRALSGITTSNNVAVKINNYTLQLSDSTILCDATAGGFTITLPIASSAINKIYTISKIDDTYNLISFSPAIRVTSSETINSMNFSTTIKVMSDGTNWKLIN